MKPVNFLQSLLPLIFVLCTSIHAQQLPNTTQPAPGTLLAHAGAEMGRLAIIEILGDYVITVPEIPSSAPGSDHIMRAWDISDPSNPREVYQFGVTRHPFLAHGLVKRNNELFIGPNTPDTTVRNAIRLNPNGTLSLERWSGASIHWDKSGMMHPWAARTQWSYNAVGGNTWLTLRGQQTASWDLLGQTGVIGFMSFMGNLMFASGDQTNTGMASYDVSNPASPQLLDVLRRPMTHPTILIDDDWNPVPAEYGLGGYWSEISHHYMVFARRGTNPGIQVVDFSDPGNLRLHCDFLVKDPRFGLNTTADRRNADPMYVAFQDEFVFSERFKLNLHTCQVTLVLDEIGNRVETSQYARPIGNLLLTGGMENWQITTNPSGLGIWVHQSTRDTRPPAVSYHIPRANQTNYPIVAPISIMIPETLRSETIRVGDTLRVIEVGGSDIPIDYILSHTGMLTIDPLELLRPNTTYEVRLQNIEDAVRNRMALYTFRFSTGPTLAGGSSSSSSSAPASSSSSSTITSSSSSSSVPVSVSSSSQSSAPAISSSSHSSLSSSSSSSQGTANTAPRVDSIAVSPTAGIVVGDTIHVDVLASDADNDRLQYRFRVQNVTDYTPWRDGNSFSHAFQQAGNYLINVQVRDAHGAQAAGIASVSVLNRLVQTAAGPTSGPMSLARDDDSLWVVNPDNDTVTRLHARNLSTWGEFATGRHPTSVAVAGNGHIWVTSQGDDRIDIFDNRGRLQHSIATGYGSAPAGIVMDRQNPVAYVALYGKGELVRFNTNNRQETGRLGLGYSVKALALSPDGGRLLAARFISGDDFGEVWDVATQSFSLTRTFRLYPSLTEDSLVNGRGLPNYLSSLIVNGDGTRAYVVGKKDNVARGLLNANEDLDDDNTVRTIGMTLDLNNGTELRNARIDFDNADSPSALALAPNENYLFVAMQGRNQVFVVNLDGITQQTGGIATQFTTGLAPQGLILDRQNLRLFVQNFMDRSVTAIELGDFLAGGTINPASTDIITVANERLSPEVLRGKQLFYNASDGIHGNEFTGRLSAEGYISCASCHLDGGHDGRTYDFTGRGEGLRNNISLQGRGGTRFGNVHWSGNFDEIQDFENDIRDVFRGSGLMNNDDFAATRHPLGAAKAGLSDDLDALAAYVASLGKDSLRRSPYRTAGGDMTSDALAGEALFDSLGCASCHRGKAFTDGVLHDVGTLRHYSGQRLGEPLPGIKTPSLLSLFDTAPYLHDGSASTLAEIFELAGGSVYQAEDLTPSGATARLDAQHFSYYRGGAAVRLSSGGSLTVNAHSDTTGSGKLRVRVSSATGGRLSIVVNGAVQTLTLPQQAAVESQTIAFSEVSAKIPLQAGDNTIRISRPSGNNIIVDDLTLSTPADINKAQVHTQVGELNTADREKLLAYLLQLDQQSAPEDGDTISLGTGQSGGSSSPAASSSSSASSSSVSNSQPTQVSSSSQSQSTAPGDGKGGGSGALLLLILLAGMMMRGKGQASAIR